MSTKTFDSAISFAPASKTSAGGFFKAVGDFLSAIREGIDLAGQYKDLTNRGMSSDVAARKVFDQMEKAAR